MGFENFSPKPGERKNEDKDSEKKEEVDEGRRKFLKFAGKALVVGAAVSAGLEACGPEKKEEKKKKPLLEPKRGPLIEESPEICLDENDKDNREVGDDERTVRDVITYDSKERIDIDIAKKTQLLWEHRYSKVPKFKNSLAKGLERMGESQVEEVLAIFEDEKRMALERGCLYNFDKRELDKAFRVPKDLKIPKELAFLSMAESHFDKNAISKKRAVGLFQLMKRTATDFGLKVNDKVDERFDAEKNTRAAIRCLIDLYVRTMNARERNEVMDNVNKGDWNLALAGYNGSYIWKYMKNCGKRGVKPSYDEFLLHISNELNDGRNYHRDRRTKFIKYEVRENDTLSSISQAYKIDPKLLEKTNKIKKGIVKKVQKIKIPLFIGKVSNEKTRRAAFGKFVSGYAENLTYPPKYLAILKLIKQKKPEWFTRNNNLNNKEHASSNPNRG